MLLEISKKSRKIIHISLRFYSQAVRKVDSGAEVSNYRTDIFKNVPQGIPISPSKLLLKCDSPPSSILTLIPKEPVDSIDYYSKQIEGEEVFGEAASDAVVLSSLRNCQLFNKGRIYLDRNLSKLNALAITEGARLLALAKNCGQDEADDPSRAEKMSKQLTNFSAPFSMKKTVQLFLQSLYDSKGFTSAIYDYINEGAPYTFVYRRESYATFCCHLLRNNQVDLLLKLLPYSLSEDPDEEPAALNMYDSPEVVYALLKSLENTDEVTKKKLIDWYFRALLNLEGPVPVHEFLNLVVRVMKAADVKLKQTKVHTDGRLWPQKQYHIKLQEDTLDYDEFKKELSQMILKQVKQGATVSQHEILQLKKSVELWKSRAIEGKAIVVDTLNVTYKALDFRKLIEKLIVRFPNVLLVTRLYQVEKLKAMNLPGNTHIFYCNRLSEDDVAVITATLLYGNDCYALSNDRFGLHVNKFSARGKDLFKKWIQQRVVRFDPNDAKFSVPNAINQKVRNLSGSSASPEALFMPVLVDTSNLPYYSLWVAQR